ncbi:MAG TPA: hypothetical protein PLD25_14020 [Chloroflexota bacterium]|nr:hypothetical protein [Chloroflexota bacterium]HUM68827.1 hypothetical protein [Chloroflexota bacterium]
MDESNNFDLEDDLREEYDFSQLKGGVRGKYARRVRQGANLVLLAPDVAPFFKNDEAVNHALRLLIQLARNEVAELQPTPDS